MEGVRIMSSLEDKLDRLLISFKDAKVCIRHKFPVDGDRLLLPLIDCALGVVSCGT
jgi:hypothetical protein